MASRRLEQLLENGDPMKKQILVADDSITIQKVAELTFPEADYEVTCVSNGAQALQRLGQLRPDAALLDVVMPEQNGYDVCAHIRQNPETSWVPVLLLTGAFEPFDEKRAREVGADGQIKKPFESRALLTRVEQLLAARPRPGTAAAAQAPSKPAGMSAASGRPAAAPPVIAAGSPDIFQRVPPGPAAKPEPAPSRQASPASPPPAQAAARPARPAVARDPGGAPAAIPEDVLQRAVREAVAGISEKIVREVAWEVIPDLAEAMIRRRIHELEQEADTRAR